MPTTTIVATVTNARRFTPVNDRCSWGFDCDGRASINVVIGDGGCIVCAYCEEQLRRHHPRWEASDVMYEEADLL